MDARDSLLREDSGFYRSDYITVGESGHHTPGIQGQPQDGWAVIKSVNGVGGMSIKQLKVGDYRIR